MNSLICRKLRIGYGTTTVAAGLDVQLAEKSLHVLLGANGAGKTTLLRTVAGLQAPLAGEIELLGRDPRSLPARERARLAAYVRPLEHEMPVAHLRVHEAVRLGRAPHSPWWSWGGAPGDEAIIAAALRRCGLEDFAERSIDTLSSGEMQRVWLALALVQEPKIILLDEPTSRLDLRYACEMLEILAAVAHDGVTVFASMHDIQLALAYADSVVLMGDGRILAAGPPQTVISQVLLRQAYHAPVAIHEAHGGLWVRVDPKTGD